MMSGAVGRRVCTVMHVLYIDPEPLTTVRYLNAARGGGTESRLVRVVRAVVDGLPQGLGALVATADLQGVVPDPVTRESVLLGIAVVQALEGLAADGALPALATCGALLAGDLYSVPGADKRGGFGDVRPVWAEFARAFRWVAGVAGNHDDVSHVKNIANAHLLDMASVELDGLRVAGVGLICGNPAKKGRRAEHDQLERIELMCSARPNVLVLHEGPTGDGEQQGGSDRIAEVLADEPPRLTVCGHEPWPNALSGPTSQVLNVCERVVVMMRAT